MVEFVLYFTDNFYFVWGNVLERLLVFGQLMFEKFGLFCDIRVLQKNITQSKDVKKQKLSVY